ncbi:cytochrome p450 [Holotrichia oblita]|uniref:Cytochrome p450 n=1 Tax=Holotrichia oblita TaxID=644536 RepID=A0ACB9T7L6_HOLOL|nr:cytochrome p450 [Holotrichia oblita]
MRVQYGGVYIYTSPMFLPIDPEFNKEILIKSFQYFQGRGFYSTEHQPVSENLFTKDGEKWSILRTKFTPMFTPSKLKGMFNLMIEATKPMEKYIKEHHNKQMPLNAKDCATRFTTDVTATCVFGFESNSFLDDILLKQLNEILVKSTRLLRLLFCIALPKVANFLRIPLLPPQETDLVCKNLEESVKYRRENNITKTDFLQLLIDLKNNSVINLTELKAQCLLFLIGGYETTAATISFMLLELAHNQDIQEKLRTEINEILPSYGGEICYDAVMDMKYLEMVLCETLRKHPAAPFLLRKCVKDFTINDITIERNTTIVIPTIGLHYDPEYYPKPDVFDPERFSDTNKNKIVPYTYLPFGEGPRNCIGDRLGKQQVKVAVVSFIQQFKIKLNPEVTFPLEYDTFMILTPKRDILLDIELV